MFYNYVSSAFLITRIFGCSDDPYTCSDGTDLTDCTSSCPDSECTAQVCCDGEFYDTECEAYQSCSSTMSLYDASAECSESLFQCPSDGTTDILAIYPNECCSFMFHECCIKECGDELIHGLYYESNGNGSCYYDYHDASQCDPDWLDQFTFNGTVSFDAMCIGLDQEDCLDVTMDGHPVCLYDTSFKQCYSIQGDGAYPGENDLTKELNTETVECGHCTFFNLNALSISHSVPLSVTLSMEWQCIPILCILQTTNHYVSTCKVTKYDVTVYGADTNTDRAADHEHCGRDHYHFLGHRRLLCVGLLLSG